MKAAGPRAKKPTRSQLTKKKDITVTYFGAKTHVTRNLISLILVAKERRYFSKKPKHISSDCCMRPQHFQ
jgi:hypothetical protein